MADKPRVVPGRGASSGRTGAGTPSHISRFGTRDPDQFRAWISARYADHERRVRPGAGGAGFFAEHGALDTLRYVRTRYWGVTQEVESPPLPVVSVGLLYDGEATIRWRGGESRVGHQGLFLLPLYGSRAWGDSNHTLSVTVPSEVLLRLAEESSGIDRARVRFTGLGPVGPEAHQQLIATMRYLHRGIQTRALGSPLLVAAGEQLLAATILSAFPNTTMTTEVRTPRDPANPAAVRRALAYIDAHAGDPITLSDIAAAAGVVPRTLQYAFRRHRDTTPTAYLRRVRLEHAHEDLLAAHPGDGTTVRTVAARWGFASPHRFAAAYRQVFGVAPAQTLRS